MGNNKNLMESILAHLRKLISLVEPGEEENLEKLVHMACSVSNQLVKIENGEFINEDLEESDEDNDESE